MFSVKHIGESKENVKEKKTILVMEDISGTTFVTQYLQTGSHLSEGRVLNLEELVENINMAFENQDKEPNSNTNRNYRTTIMDERILVQRHNLLVWTYTPKINQPLYFKFGNYGYVGQFNWPTLLFKYQSGTLSVAVIRSAHKRPTGNTRIYHAPLPNVYTSGKICLGTAIIPKTADIEKISMAYLDSTKTHFVDSFFPFRDQSINSPSRYLKWIKKKANSKILVSELKPMGTVERFINTIAL